MGRFRGCFRGVNGEGFRPAQCCLGYKQVELNINYKPKPATSNPHFVAFIRAVPFEMKGGSRQRAGSYKAAFNDFLYLSFKLTRCAILEQSVHAQESAAYLVLLKDTLNPICNCEYAVDIH